MTTEEIIDKCEQRVRQLEKQVRELTEIKQKLSVAEKKYRLLVDNANDAIFVLQDGKLKFANPKALEMGGVLGDDLGKFHYADYLHPEERQKVMERHEKRIEGQTVLNTYPLRIIRRDGNIFWAEVNAVRIEWDGRPATLNIIRDITAQKLVEKQYFQMESLETLRTLSGGLAHSFNNLLMGIQGRVSVIKHSHDLSEIQSHLEGIESCVVEAVRLTDQMLGFSQSGKYQIVPVALDKLVDTVLANFDKNGRNITILRSYAPDLENILGDRYQLEQVVMNILLNSWQAIEHQGWITITVEKYDMNEARQPTGHLLQGKWIRLAIQDNGIGMDESVCKRVFEPFFTTKGMGRHRGLGLSSVYGIVANHNGVINIDSIPGFGTTVYIYFPVADADDE